MKPLLLVAAGAAAAIAAMQTLAWLADHLEPHPLDDDERDHCECVVIRVPQPGPLHGYDHSDEELAAMIAEWRKEEGR